MDEFTTKYKDIQLDTDVQLKEALTDLNTVISNLVKSGGGKNLNTKYLTESVDKFRKLFNNKIGGLGENVETNNQQPASEFNEPSQFAQENFPKLYFVDTAIKVLKAALDKIVTDQKGGYKKKRK
jgi:hypothetical protein